MTHIRSDQAELKRTDRVCQDIESSDSDSFSDDYQYIRAEMWKIAAGENLSFDQLTKRLLSRIGCLLELDSICVYKTDDLGDAHKLALWSLSDCTYEFDISIPIDQIGELVDLKKVVSAGYYDNPIQEVYSTRLLKRFNGPLSIISIKSDSMNCIFFFPDFALDRKWQKWEIDCFCELIDILCLKLNQFRSAGTQFPQNADYFLEAGSVLDKQLSMIRYLESLALLSGGIANDFNTILGQIYSRLFMAKSQIMEFNDIYKWITEAEEAAYKGVCLSKKLSFFSDGSAFVKETLSVKSLIEDSVGFVLKDSLVDYILDLPENLWCVEVDKGRIEQVIRILVENAAQSMSDKGIVQIAAVNFSFTCGNGFENFTDQLPLEEGDYVKISFTDHGCGIPQEFKNKVFIPYFTTKLNGNGLGLTTAFAIIRQHKGHICFHSAQGKGSTFIIYLPVANSHDTEPLNHFRPLQTIGDHVLLIVQEPIIRIILRKWLSNSAFRVVIVSSMEQALELCREKNDFEDPFSLAVIDLSISDFYSIQQNVCRLKTMIPGIKIVAYCSGAGNCDTVRSKEAGFDAILDKNFSLNELSVIIKDVFSEGTTIEV